MTLTHSARTLFRKFLRFLPAIRTAAATPAILAAMLLAAPAAELQAQDPDWSRPFPGHRVIGNLYAVGTYGLGVFLVTSDEGHILINTGLEDSTPLIRANIESVGYRLEDVRILLTMQSHWDHTAALAEIKEIAGAEMWATADDSRVLEDGGFSDPHFGGSVSFRPIEVDRILSDGEIIELGDTRLRVHEHPGHTEGSSSYTMQVNENDRDYAVAIANLGTINEGKKAGRRSDLSRRSRRLRADLRKPESHGRRCLGGRPRRSVRLARQVRARPGLRPRRRSWTRKVFSPKSSVSSESTRSSSPRSGAELAGGGWRYLKGRSQ